MAQVVRHIVWDWNGTLFDDHDAVMRAANASLVRIGARPLSVRQYRELYCRPVRVFYQRAAGRTLTDDEWRVIDEVFHQTYRTALPECGLAVDAHSLLTAWPTGGRTQSLLSMWDHTELVPLVTTMGIADLFLRVDGRRGESGERKAASLVDHLRRLDLDPAEVGLIGDTLDDAEAARSVGAACVLCTGSHEVETLRTAGVPVVEGLAAAIGQLSAAA